MVRLCWTMGGNTVSTGMRWGMGEMECVHGASVLDYGWQYSVYRDEMGYG